MALRGYTEDLFCETGTDRVDPYVDIFWTMDYTFMGFTSCGGLQALVLDPSVIRLLFLCFFLLSEIFINNIIQCKVMTCYALSIGLLIRLSCRDEFVTHN